MNGLLNVPLVPAAMMLSVVEVGPAGAVLAPAPHVVSDGGKSYLTQFVYDRGAGQPPGNFVIAPFTP